MYLLIGISMVFASLFLVNVLASLAVSVAWQLVSRLSNDWTGRFSANFIFTLRVLPLAAALTAIFAFVLPAFIRFEPAETGETIGWKMALLVAASTAGMIAAGVRIFLSWRRTSELLARWSAEGTATAIAGISCPAFLIRHPFPVIAVVGFFRPRLFVAEQVLGELEPLELAAAVSHELGHVAEWDNLKRVVVRLCGDMLLLPIGSSFDRLWSDSAERAADEHAAHNGATGAALDLASALLKIGRLAPKAASPELPLASYLISGADASLADRIGRLVRIADAATPRMDRGRANMVYIIPAVVLLAMLPLAMSETVLYNVYLLAEELLAVLQ